MAMAPGQAERENLRRLLELAQGEDLGGGDVTGAVLPPQTSGTARFLAREPLVVCGAAFLAQIARAYSPGIRTQVFAAEGDAVEPPSPLAEWEGPVVSMLSAERVALNFVQHLSGVATATRQYVEAVAGTGATIVDTRKTTPGWRALEKYAVRAGGGRNHRMGLYDAVLVKDNHLSALSRAGGRDPIAALADRIEPLRATLGKTGFVEVEADTPEQVDAALRLPVDIVMLDNMTPDQLRQAVRRRDEAGLAGKVQLEASGSITLANVREVAATGVERIAVGAITHSARAVDIAMDIEA
jgi:nicotinate-nucleotide pyrophosphorylase (carboxylating)